MVSAAAGMIKKLAKANGVELNPFQIKHIISYSATLAQDTTYDLKLGNPRYLGLDLMNPDHNPNKKSNIRNLNLYNALVIAKNLNNYDVILRKHNIDDYAMATEFENWSNSFDFVGYQSDELIGIKTPDCKSTISFRTLNEGGGYSYGYQMYYGKQYGDRGAILDYYAGYNFFDRLDGTAGVYGANSNEQTTRKYLAEIKKDIHPDKIPCGTYISEGKNPSTNTVGTLNVKGFIDNDTTTPPLEVNKGDNVGISINGNKTIDLNSISVEIDGHQVTLKSIVDNYIVFGITDNIPTGVQNVIVKYVDNSGSITYQQALNILSNQNNKTFPESITVNGVTTNLNYGFNFDFSEGIGNSVHDKSGNANNGLLSGFNSSLPERFSLQDGTNGVRFGNESYLKVADNNSYEMNESFTILSKLKVRELNKYQTLLVKASGKSGLLDSYILSIDEKNRIVLSLLKGGSDNNCSLLLVSEPLNINTNETFGVAVSFDQKNKILKLYKNNIELNYTVDNSAGGSLCSSISQYNHISDSPLDLFIGSYVYDNGSIHYSNTDLQELYAIANIKNIALTSQQIEYIFSTIGLVK